MSDNEFVAQAFVGIAGLGARAFFAFKASLGEKRKTLARLLPIPAPFFRANGRRCLAQRVTLFTMTRFVPAVGSNVYATSSMSERIKNTPRFARASGESSGGCGESAAGSAVP